MKHKIYQNKWVNYKRYFIPTHPVRTSGSESSKMGGIGLMEIEGRWRLDKNAVYYTNDLKDETHFPTVGEIDIDFELINCILSAITQRED